ncbi:Protein NLP1 [Camellia lanceoleosa]|uniref:Protein NLP1 n=1 Tax=Camellia lanceoleosa TaxID=1840588 RepID=A0ACC0G3Z8_9ERIC|nr:Protein NLP1 [Camellia lanceoleosa]
MCVLCIWWKKNYFSFGSSDNEILVPFLVTAYQFSVYHVSELDLGSIDMAFHSGILRALCHLTRLCLSSGMEIPSEILKLRHLRHLYVYPSHIHPMKPYFPSHKHAMTPYFPSLTHPSCTHDIKACFLSHDDIDKLFCDDDYEIDDLSENAGSPNDLICLYPTTETLEGRIEPTWPEYRSANPALEQHRAILPHTVPHVMTRKNAATVTTSQMETYKSMTTPCRSSASGFEVFSASLQSPQCLTGSIAQDNLAQSCPLPAGCFLEEERSIDIMDSPIELPCSDPALKLTTAQGSLEEERYVKIINPSTELYSRPQCIKIPQVAGPALQPEAFPNVGKIMQLDSSEQVSSVRFDATNIGGNVVSANKNCTTTCSQKKITITELLPLIGLKRKVAAGKIGVSIPTFKRLCRLNNIIRWPDYRNEKQCHSLKLKLATESEQGAAGAFGHFVTGSHTGAVGLNHHNSPCSKSPKRQREKKTSPSCKTPSTVATCSDPAPMKAMSTFPQIMPHLRAGQDARIEILKTTEDIPIQSVQGVTTRSCLSPQKRAGSDVPSTSSPKHFHCTEIMDQMLESSHPAPKGQLQEQSKFHLQKQNAGTAIIKAKYGNKTVIVPPPTTSGIVKLKEELARRLALEHGSFYVEYEDEDHDWILIACDDALQECLTSSTSRDNQVIRLSVRDEVVNSQNSGKALEC